MTKVDIPGGLIDEIKEGNGVLFIGTGLSMGAGLLSWEQLVRPLGKKIGCSPNIDLLKVTEYFQDERGRPALLEHIMKATDTTGTKPTKNHRLLTELPIEVWITTNYDDLLEKTLEEAGKRFHKVVRDRQVPFINAKLHNLVKMHGDRQQPDTIVITENDYHTYFRRYLSVTTQLSALAANSTFLFIGYSMRDPDFNQIYAEVAFYLKEYQRRSYSVLFDADKFVIRNLDRRNITVINIPMQGKQNYTEQLGEVLKKLVEQCK